jgi:HSP90 family molecular chaperone
MTNTLKDARERKVKKYEPIVKEAKDWLMENSEEIKIKHKVTDINVNCKFIIISSMEIVPQETEDDR